MLCQLDFSVQFQEVSFDKALLNSVMCFFPLRNGSSKFYFGKPPLMSLNRSSYFEVKAGLPALVEGMGEK